MADSFRLADDVLLAGVRSVTDLMVTPGLINLDFADVQVSCAVCHAWEGLLLFLETSKNFRGCLSHRTYHFIAFSWCMNRGLSTRTRQAVMKGMGSAMMGSGEASGEDRAIKAAELALQNPLLGNLSVASAKGMLVNITGGPNLSLYDVR